MTQTDLVDITARAAQAGFAFEATAPGIATWNRATGDGSTLVPVYVTRLLWSSLGDEQNDPAFAARLESVLSAARQAIEERVIRQNAWRAGFKTDVATRSVDLWVILNHHHSNGIAIGYGPGDFWDGATGQLPA